MSASDAGASLRSGGAREGLTTAVALVGTLLTFAYATVAWLQIMVWNPRAALPGMQVEDIWAEVASAQGTNTPVATTINLIVLPAGALLLLWFSCTGKRNLHPATATASYLALLAAGVAVYFVASFSPGMNLADTYAIDGGDYAPGGKVLLGVSGLAVAGLLQLWIVSLDLPRRKTIQEP